MAMIMMVMGCVMKVLLVMALIVARNVGIIVIKS
jgi:hypothetical protein